MTVIVRMVTALLIGLAAASCGPEIVPTARPHGFVVETLEADPHGPRVDTHSDVHPGSWRYEITKTWAERRGSGDARPGRARLAMLVEIRREGDGLRTYVELDVLKATGIAARYVREFDGLRVSLAHGPDGRADPRQMRFESQATLKARSFLRGLWLAGLAGATPWIPAAALQAGQTWSRASLGEARYLAGLDTGGDAAPRFRGGGRVEAIEKIDGEVILVVRFDGLVESSFMRRDEALSEGMHDVGTARIRARDGLPLAWRFEQEVKIHHVTRRVETSRHVRLEVEGKIASVSGSDR